jgi:hypothetical protein
MVAKVVQGGRELLGKIFRRKRSHTTKEAVALMRPLSLLNNITAASFQAMISQTVENVIANVKNP